MCGWRCAVCARLCLLVSCVLCVVYGTAPQPLLRYRRASLPCQPAVQVAAAKVSSCLGIRRLLDHQLAHCFL